MHRQPQGARRTDRKRRKPHPKEKSPSLKDNLLTGGRSGQVNLEADLQSGEHNGKPRIPEKTPQPQRGTPAAAERKAEPPTEAPTPAGRKECRVRKTTPDPEQGSGR